MDDQTVITISGIDVSQNDKLILSDVRLSVDKGEFVYLIGRTGTGKTSLLRIIYADLPFHAGDAEVCGYELKNIRKKNVPYLRRKLGIVFQDFQLLEDRNVEKNLEFVLKATGWKDKQKIKQRIIEVLEEVGLLDKIKSMPHRLSGGEKQKIGIARALLNHPEVILADEPTGNLDPETSNDIMRLLIRISENGTSVIMATHNYNIIYKFPGKVIKCEDGKVIVSSNKLD
ncbi:MAG: ATP-binding cassette domain-containing protein [Chlorobi bacterium]|nr:ATP-binding cassette domain-containing protein [Chlorobiota bacterium]